ncbi:MAG: VOC family protein [Gammaproteobacteria bacterium]
MAGIIVNIDVPDVGLGRRFYEGGLGFEYSRSLFGGAVVELAAESTTVYLIQHDVGSRPVQGNPGTRDYSDHWTPVHLDVIVDDIDQALQRAIEAGARAVGEQQAREWGKLAPLRDPFGHGVCLLQFSGPGYDLVQA